MEKMLGILAGIGAVILIGGLLVLTIAFTGNPISRLLATRAGDRYIRENYPDLKLEREKSYYNFKDGNYGVKYIDRKSKDIHFTIGTDYLGRITRDGYKEDVLSLWNTRLRLEDEYSHYVEKIIKDNLDYQFEMILPSSFAHDKDEGISNLQVDMVFDLKNIPFEQELTLYIIEENRTWDRLAEIILQVDELVEREDLHPSRYTLVLMEARDEESKVRDSIGVYYFPREDLKQENLPKALEKSFHEFNQNGKY